MKPGISAIIVVHNQLDLLKKCVASIRNFADEIILIDLESTDDIKGFAKEVGAIYKAHPRKVVIVEEIRQTSLAHAKYEYVLFMDPDETLPASLTDKLSDLARGTMPDFVRMPRKNYIFGKWIEHSQWWPDYQIRFFKKDALIWDTTIHAQPQTRGIGETLEDTADMAIMHQNYLNIDEWFTKNLRYARTRAKELSQNKEPYTLLQAMGLSVGEIMQRFFAAEGYKDGMHGLMLALLQSFYHFMVYAYYWEGKKYAELETGGSIKAFPHNWFKHGLSETMHWEAVKSPLKRIKAKLVRSMLA